jgi:hypothetical protein
MTLIVEFTNLKNYPASDRLSEGGASQKQLP